jgi:hypothetical protein
MDNKRLLEAAQILRDKAKEIFDFKTRQADNAASVVVYLDEQVAKIKQEIKDKEIEERNIEVIHSVTDCTKEESIEEEPSKSKPKIAEKNTERYFNKFKVREQ